MNVLDCIFAGLFQEILAVCGFATGWLIFKIIDLIIEAFKIVFRETKYWHRQRKSKRKNVR